MRSNAILAALVILLVHLLIVISVPMETTGESRYTIEGFESGVSNGLPNSGDYNCIGVGDLNGDQNMDIICGAEANYGAQPRTGLYVFTGDGAGNWGQINLTTSNSFAGIEVADCDNDGLQEVYAGYQENANGIGAWEWTGTGFGTGGITSPLTSGGVNYLRIVNMTGDAGLDMAVGTHNGVRYYRGSGGAPVSWTQFSTGLRSSGLCTQIDVNDMNNDGLMDIIVGQYGDGLYIFTQDAGGTSWTDRSSSLPTPEQTGRVLGVTTGDVNNDGNVDIVLDKRTNPSGLFLLLGNGGGGTGTDFQWTYLNNSWPNRPQGTFYQSHLVDMDMDGDLDLLTAKESTGLHLYLGNGSEAPGNNFGWTEVTGKGLPTTGFYTGANYLDFDNDGDLDIAGCMYGGGMIVLKNNLTLPHVPKARAGADQTVFLGNIVHLDGTNSSDIQDCPDGDSGGDMLSYQWNITAQPAGSILTDDDLDPSDSVSTPSFIPTHPGNYFLTLAVRDTELHWGVSEDTVKITVVELNNVPVAHAGTNQSVHSGDVVTLNGSGSYDLDEAMGMLTFDWNVSAGNPSTVSLSEEESPSPTFIAPEVTGDYGFTLSVMDSLGAWSNEDEVIIYVELPPNIRPIADAGVDFSTYSNTTVLLNGSASHDPDGAIVTWDWNCTSQPSLPISNENSSAPSFLPERTGQYIFTLNVRDDRRGWGNEDDVVITVIEENLPPVANAGEDLIAYYDERTSLNGSASHDIEGYILSWDWNCTSHASLVMENKNSSRPAFTPTAVGTHVFSLRVMDDLGLWSSTDMVNVTVIERPVNRIPVAHAGKDQTVRVNSTVILDGNNSNDPDGFIAMWEWFCPTHPALVLMDGNSSGPTFLAREIGTYEMILKVMDNGGAWSTKDSVLITVVSDGTVIENGSKNTLPVISLTSHRNIDYLSGISTISWTALDGDGDPLSFKIQLLDQDGALIRTLAEGLPSGTRIWYWNTANETDGSYRLKLVTSDGTDTVQFTTEPFNIISADKSSPEDRTSYGAMAIWIGSFAFILIFLATIFFLLRARRDKKDPKPWDDMREVEDDVKYRWGDIEGKYRGREGGTGEAYSSEGGTDEAYSSEGGTDEAYSPEPWKTDPQDWGDYPKGSGEGTTSYDDEIGWDDDGNDDEDWSEDDWLDEDQDDY